MPTAPITGAADGAPNAVPEALPPCPAGAVWFSFVSPRAWITVGWLFIAAMAGFAAAAIVLVLGASPGGRVCVQLAGVTCPGSGPQFLVGLICAVGAGVAFFSGLACFLWAAHLRTLHALARVIGHDATR